MNEQEFNSLPLAQRKAAQQRLIDAGLYSGSPDGLWGSGTSNAFRAEETRRVDDAERERKAKTDQEERERQDRLKQKELSIKELETQTKTKAEQEERARQDRLREKELGIKELETKSKASESAAKTKEIEAKTKRKEEYDRQSGSGLGIGTQIAANVLAPMAGTAVGMGLGKTTNYMMDKSQESRNKVLQGVAADRISGLTTAKGAREAAKLSGAVPMGSPFARTTARMLPHIGLGALSVGKGLKVLGEENPDGSFYPEMANRAAGLGYIGAGAGLFKQGLRYGNAPSVAPDAKSLAIINSEGLRRPRQGASSSSPAMDGDSAPDASAPKAIAGPEGDKPTPGKRAHSERLKAAAKAAGASGRLSKNTASEYLLANINDQNRATIGRELGIKPGPKFGERITTAIKNMSKPGASALLGPAGAAALAFAASPKPANASEGEVTGSDEALTNAGIAGGIAAGTERAIRALPKATGQALGTAGAAFTPGLASDMTDDFASPENRNWAARNFPSWMRAGAVEDAYQAAQVPERGDRSDASMLARDRLRQADEMPLASASSLTIPEGIPAPRPDGSSPYQDVIDRGLNIARYARGGVVSGGLHYEGGGRTDNIPLEVQPGTYILPADFVSALGQGNTLAGIKVLDNMFPPREMTQFANGGKAAEGAGNIPIIAAGGEFQISPLHVAELGDGDVEVGANMLDQWVKDVRAQHIETLSNLPGPQK